MRNRSTTTRQAFPTRAQLEAAVAAIPTTTDKRWRKTAGPRYRLEISPGSIRVTATDYYAASLREGLAADVRARQNIKMGSKKPPPIRQRGDMGEWSQKSRARMPWRLATLNYALLFQQGETPALVTLTYPGDWARLAPDAATFKRHVNALRQKYLNSWGGRTRAWAGIWKMEFQRRGSVHLHIGTTIPEGVQAAPLSADDEAHLTDCDLCSHPAHLGLFEFREWLSREWSAIVFKDHEQPPVPWSAEGWANERAKHERVGTGVDPDEAHRYSDPKRIGVYFAKHGMFESKNYQNEMPSLWRAAGGPGARFWGYWVIKPLEVSKEMHESLIITIMSGRPNRLPRWRSSGPPTPPRSGRSRADPSRTISRSRRPIVRSAQKAGTTAA